MKKRIAVIGRGVIGLTSGIQLLEHGFDVCVFSRDPAARTTSMAAGAYWWPYKAFPIDRVARWATESLQKYRTLALNPTTGISPRKHYRFCKVRDDAIDAIAALADGEQINGLDFGIPCREAYLLTTPLIEVPLFIPFLEDCLLRAGGSILQREISSPAELFSEFDLVVNCSGVWAGTLVNDPKVYPIRGQIVRVSLPEGLTNSIRVVESRDDQFTLILPRSKDCVLGGTSEPHNWSVMPDEKTSEAIIDRCTKIQPALLGSQILGASVGLRPGRETVRLELEMIAPGKPLIHNYGHGGGGFTVAWGCADEVASLAAAHLRN